jgi:hypothetical protein
MSTPVASTIEAEMFQQSDNIDINEVQDTNKTRHVISDLLARQNTAFQPLYLSWPFNQLDDQSGEVDEDTSTLSHPEDGNIANIFNFALDANDISPAAPYQLNLSTTTLAAPAPSLCPISLPTGPTSELFSNYRGEDTLSRPGHTDAVNGGEQISTYSSVDHDPGTLLAELQQNLAKQLDLLRVNSWDLNCCFITPTGYAGSNDEASFNPLASILGSTTKFLSILRLWKTSSPNTTSSRHQRDQSTGSMGSYSRLDTILSTGSSSDSHSILTPISRSSGVNLSRKETTGSVPTTTDPSPSPLPVFHLLTVVSCYLLIVSIFDTIFSRILANLSERPEGFRDAGAHAASTSALLTPPIQQRQHIGADLAFTGHPLPFTPQLRTRLLVQVVEYHLELLEQALGLPRSYCVSKARLEGASSDITDESGILNRREARSLLRAIIEDESGLGCSGGMSKAATSLRNNLKILQRVTGRDFV